MPHKLQKEIQQTKPFRDLEQEAMLNIMRTADLINYNLARLLKPHGLTPTQYNALRIVRGAGEEGLPCRIIGQRMVTRVPDVTRLLDRMERDGLVRREREEGDRRVVRTWITEKGLKLMAGLDGPMNEFPRTQLGNVGERGLRNLIEALEAARS